MAERATRTQVLSKLRAYKKRGVVFNPAEIVKRWHLNMLPRVLESILNDLVLSGKARVYTIKLDGRRVRYIVAA